MSAFVSMKRVNRKNFYLRKIFTVFTAIFINAFDPIKLFNLIQFYFHIIPFQADYCWKSKALMAMQFLNLL